MRRPVGVLGGIGLLLVLAGIGVIAYIDPLLAAGLLGVLIGLGLVVGDVLRRMMARLGLTGMF